jgi:hypothetical protein
MQIDPISFPYFLKNMARSFILASEYYFLQRFEQNPLKNKHLILEELPKLQDEFIALLKNDAMDKTNGKIKLNGANNLHLASHIKETAKFGLSRVLDKANILKSNKLKPLKDSLENSLKHDFTNIPEVFFSGTMGPAKRRLFTKFFNAQKKQKHLDIDKVILIIESKPSSLFHHFDLYFENARIIYVSETRKDLPRNIQVIHPDHFDWDQFSDNSFDMILSLFGFSFSPNLEIVNNQDNIYGKLKSEGQFSMIEIASKHCKINYPNLLESIVRDINSAHLSDFSNVDYINEIKNSISQVEFEHSQTLLFNILKYKKD